MRQIADALVAALGCKTRILFSGEVREGDPRSLVADIRRAEALGFRPSFSLADGMARLAGWLLSIKAGAAA